MGTKLEAAVGQFNINVPSVFSDIRDGDLTSDITIDEKLHVKGAFLKNGGTAGTITVVTLFQYWDNGGEQYLATEPTSVQFAAVIADAIAAGDTVDLQLAAYEWSDTPIVWADATNAASTAVNLGYY